MSTDLSSDSFGFEDVHNRLTRGESISEREKKLYEDQLEPIEEALVENEEGGYEAAFDISYLDKPDFTEEEDQVNFLAGDALGINDAYANAVLEGKDEAHVLAIGEPAPDTKLSSEYAWDGLAWKLEQLKEEKGEEYFEDDKFATAVSGSLYGRHPLFYSITNDDEMELLGYSDEDFDDEVEKVASALEEDTVEAIIEERVSTEENLEEYTKAIQEMMDEGIDNEQLASKIVTYTQSRKEIEKRMGKISDAIGRDVPLYLADGEEGRENMKEIKDVSIENYKEEVEGVAEEVDEKADQLQETLEKLQNELKDTEEDYSELRSEIEEALDEGYDTILNTNFEQTFENVDVRGTEIGDIIDEVCDLEKKRDSTLKDLESKVYDDMLEENAKSVEDSINEAFGPSGARVLNRRHISPDWNEILNEAVDAQYTALHEAIDNVELKEYVMDGGLAEFEVGGHNIQLAHNLNPLSDVTLKYGQTRNLENRGKLADENPDLFISGHHGEGRMIFNKDERGITAAPWAALQLGTFQDVDSVSDMMQEGRSDSWHVKRLERGQFDSTVYMVDLDVDEVKGRKFINPKVRQWFHSDLENIGKQLAAEEFVEGVEQDRIDEFVSENVEFGAEFDYEQFKNGFVEEFGVEDEGLIEGFLKTQVSGRDYKESQEHSLTLLGDQQMGAPQNGRYWYQMSTEELLDGVMDEIGSRADGDHTVLNVGDTLQGYDIYRGQHTESRGWRGHAELGDRLNRLESKLEDVGADQETINQALKDAAIYNSLQNPENDISQQNLQTKKIMDEELEQMLKDEVVEQVYEFSGNHGNENTKHNNDDEATWRASNYDQELLDEGKVNFIRGTDASRGFLRIGDKDFRVAHDTNGRGKTKADKMLTDDNPSGIAGSYSGDKHQGAVASKGKKEDDSESHKANPAMQPMNDLTDIILGGDTIQGALIEDIIDEREYIHSGQTEFLLR